MKSFPSKTNIAYQLFRLFHKFHHWKSMKSPVLKPNCIKHWNWGNWTIISNYKAQSIKSAIRRRHGEHYLDLSKALNCCSQSRDYCTSSKHVLHVHVLQRNQGKRLPTEEFARPELRQHHKQRFCKFTNPGLFFHLLYYGDTCHITSRTRKGEISTFPRWSN